MGGQFFCRDQEAIGNNDVVEDWAYGDYRWRDWLGVRAGIMRQAYGFYNETRDPDMLRNSILPPQGIYNENYRDAFSRIQGGSVYGDIGLGGAGMLSYQYSVEGFLGPNWAIALTFFFRYMDPVVHRQLSIPKDSIHGPLPCPNQSSRPGGGRRARFS